MRRLILSVIAIFFPWLTLFLLDDPIGGLIALLLQASIIGWIPATIWAWCSVSKATREAKKRKETQVNKQKKTEQNDESRSKK